MAKQRGQFWKFVFATERRKSTFASIFLLVIACILSFLILDHPFPIGNPLFQASIALVLGLIFVERLFTTPMDVISNTISSLIFAGLLLDNPNYPPGLWHFVVVSSIFLLLAGIAGNLREDILVRGTGGRLETFSNFAYRISTLFGSASSLWSIAFIGALLPFIRDGMVIASFWYLMFLLVVRVTPDIISWITVRVEADESMPIGVVFRAKTPTFLEIRFSRRDNIGLGDLVVFRETCPLCKTGHQVSYFGKLVNSISNPADDSDILGGEVLLYGAWHQDPVCMKWQDGPFGLKQVLHMLPSGAEVYSVPSIQDLPEELSKLPMFYEDETVLGHVVEGSTVSELRFQKLPHVEVERDDLVMISVGQGENASESDNIRNVFYQVRELTTGEENESSPAFEMQWVTCNQVGSLGNDCEFVAWDATPYVRLPVFKARSNISADHPNKLGHLPKTTIPVIVNSNSLISYHTAVLGTTGSGKTTLVKTLVSFLARHGKRLILFDVHDDYDGKMLGIETLEIAFRQPETEKALGNYLEYIGDLNNEDRQSVLQYQVGDEAINRIRRWHANGEFKSRWHVWFRYDQLPARAGLDKETKRVFEDFLERWYVEEHIGKAFSVLPLADENEDNTFLQIINNWLENPDVSDENVVIIKMNMLGVPEQQEIAYQISELVYRYGISCGQTELDVDSRDPIARIGLILEEAQIFISQSGQFSPGEDKAVRDKCRSSITNLALGGRKYGIGLVVVSQRSAFVSKGVLSQCNTLFALRTVNENDKSVLLDFVDRSYLSTVTYLGNPPHRPEAILMGEASPSKIPVIIRYDLPLEFQGVVREPNADNTPT